MKNYKIRVLIEVSQVAEQSYLSDKKISFQSTDKLMLTNEEGEKEDFLEEIKEIVQNSYKETRKAIDKQADNMFIKKEESITL